VATLMQDTLWCCQERIVPKKVWRVINYESKLTPTLKKEKRENQDEKDIDICLYFFFFYKKI
jgi:hypothetical protein